MPRLSEKERETGRVRASDTDFAVYTVSQSRGIGNKTAVNRECYHWRYDVNNRTDEAAERDIAVRPSVRTLTDFVYSERYTSQVRRKSGHRGTRVD